MINTQALLGTSVGNCVPQELIGQGELGAVFLAERARSRRRVAVKILSPSTSKAAPTPDKQTVFLDRFCQEIALATSLKHENILSLHENGVHEGQAYLVMPYVTGGTLQNVMDREGQMALPKIVAYLDQLAAALDYAHERGIVHQDIKPTNILLTPEGRLLLADFGLGKMVAEKQSAQMPLLQSLNPTGPLEYIAPEQVWGNALDARTDLYALGVILYQMVTGKTPFEGETAVQLLRQLVQASPPSPRLLRTDLPLAAEQVILRAMAKRPPDRYARAHDIANAFRIALTAAGVLLDGSGCEGTATTSDSATSSHLFAPRPRGLFDPMWQKGEDGVKEEAPSTAPRDLPLSSRRSRLGLKTALLRDADGTERLPARAATSEAAPPAPNGIAPLAPDTSPAVPDPVPPVPTAKVTGMLPLFGTGSANPASTAKMTGMLPPSGTGSANPAPTAKVTGILPPSGTGLANSAAVEEVSTSRQPVPNPLSPFPGIPVTGSLAPISEPGTTGTIKLKEAVKVVQVPVAGQPGRYVTGLLPMTSPTAPTAPLQLPEQPEEEAFAAVKSAFKNFELKKLKRWQKFAALALLMVLALSIFSAFLYAHTNQGLVSKKAVPTRQATPNSQAILQQQATATAVANTILTDPLSQNIHNWPVAGSGYKMYVFKDGAYHITDNDANQSAPSILPDVNLKGPMAYSLTMDEIKGDDSSINNSFGMILRFSSQARGGKNIITFYSFEVVNNHSGEYQFWKYDSSLGSSNPWKSIWDMNFGSEFHQGQGAKNSNTFKVVVNGKYFTLTVNGKKVGTAEDSSLTSGGVGMIVNLKGTEVAFSDLKLTYN